MPTSAWAEVTGEDLRQGDHLPACEVPILGPSYPDDNNIRLDTFDLIVITHSCDLVEDVQGMVVNLCQIGSVPKFELDNPLLKEGGRWGKIRNGQYQAFHLLPSPITPDDGRASLVVDFRRVFCLPISYVRRHALGCGPRSRLLSPYVEHFSQAFARYFMRIALPVEIPKFK